jgi:hypothetical protein
MTLTVKSDVLLCPPVADVIVDEGNVLSIATVALLLEDERMPSVAVHVTWILDVESVVIVQFGFVLVVIVVSEKQLPCGTLQDSVMSSPFGSLALLFISDVPPDLTYEGVIVMEFRVGAVFAVWEMTAPERIKSANIAITSNLLFILPPSKVIITSLECHK